MSKGTAMLIVRLVSGAMVVMTIVLDLVMRLVMCLVLKSVAMMHSYCLRCVHVEGRIPKQDCQNNRFG